MVLGFPFAPVPLESGYQVNYCPLCGNKFELDVCVHCGLERSEVVLGPDPENPEDNEGDDDYKNDEEDEEDEGDSEDDEDDEDEVEDDEDNL